MHDVAHTRGHELLIAHLRSLDLDPEAPTARERLEEQLGPELARKLVFGLSGGGETRPTDRRGLRARPVLTT